jgi:hypothetical protein
MDVDESRQGGQSVGVDNLIASRRRHLLITNVGYLVALDQYPTSLDFRFRRDYTAVLYQFFHFTPCFEFPFDLNACPFAREDFQNSFQFVSQLSGPGPPLC